MRTTSLILPGAALLGLVLALFATPPLVGATLEWAPVPKPRALPADDRPLIPRPFAPVPWRPVRVRMEVLVDGRPLPTIHHEGRTYLAVPSYGTEYEIRIHNLGSRRICAVVSVDGLSVISGRPASERSPGYLVGPHDSVVIKGWRRDLERVAAFQFVDREGSYARLMGHPENIGVIGLIAIEERTPWREPLPMEDRGSPKAAGARQAYGGVGETGTGYGRDLDSLARWVPFVRGPHKATVTFYYDTADALRRAGIPVGVPLPDPFPADGGFAPPPPIRR